MVPHTPGSIKKNNHIYNTNMNINKLIINNVLVKPEHFIMTKNIIY